jgi:hypothetical protein
LKRPDTNRHPSLPGLGAFIFLLAILTASCATKPPPRHDTVAPTEERGWWRAAFQMDWPEESEPRWYVDLFLAHEVIRPILESHEADIPLWRFHRRAARDALGHRFSFVFYSSPQTANQVFESIGSSARLRQLTEAGVVRGVDCDVTGTVYRPRVEDTSDPAWSEAMRRAWPHYIMGVSRLWLSLITESLGKHSSGKNPSSAPEIQALYEQVSEDITATWQQEGRHALLHHLNAIFGYEPIVVYEKRLMEF